MQSTKNDTPIIFHWFHQILITADEAKAWGINLVSDYGA